MHVHCATKPLTIAEIACGTSLILIVVVWRAIGMAGLETHMNATVSVPPHGVEPLDRGNRDII